LAGKFQIFIRTILLLILIAIIAGGGLVWFDHLGLIDVKTVLAPVYNKLGLQGRTQPAVAAGTPLNLDEERLNARLAALDLQKQQLDAQAADLQKQQDQINQESQDLAQREKAQDEKEQSFQQAQTASQSKDATITTFTQYLNSMTPAAAVNILNAMDETDVVAILRKADALAASGGGTSMASTWLMNMDPKRAADIQRKMAAAPVTATP
jgi:flagellar protein FlbB